MCFESTQLVAAQPCGHVLCRACVLAVGRRCVQCRAYIRAADGVLPEKPEEKECPEDFGSQGLLVVLVRQSLRYTSELLSIPPQEDVYPPLQEPSLLGHAVRTLGRNLWVTERYDSLLQRARFEGMTDELRLLVVASRSQGKQLDDDARAWYAAAVRCLRGSSPPSGWADLEAALESALGLEWGRHTSARIGLELVSRHLSRDRLWRGLQRHFQS